MKTFYLFIRGKNTTEFTNNIVNRCRGKDRKIDRGHIIVSLNEYLENSVFIDQNEVILVTMFSGPSKPLLIVIPGYCCTDTVQITELISLLLQHFRNCSMQKLNREVCLDFILHSRSKSANWISKTPKRRLHVISKCGFIYQLYSKELQSND